MLISSEQLKTLIYFDIFDFPLTRLELEKWTYYDNEINSITESANLIGEKYGFYFLKGRERVIRERLDRYQIAERKFKKAIKIAKIFRWIPLIKLIAVCNRLGYSNAQDDSDIDLFIITQKNRIWLTRFLTVGFLSLFNLRPKGDITRDKFCLTFFVSEGNLNLEKILLPKEKGLSDIHFIYWLSQFVPIYEKDKMWSKFTQANSWIKKYLPNFYQYQTHKRRNVKPVVLSSRCYTVSLLGNSLEKLAKKIQLAIMPKKLKELADGKNTNVIISAQILKFHANDRRRKYRNLFQQKYANFQN